MNTLPNVNTRQSGNEDILSNAGFTSNVLLSTNDLQGVSVRYAPDPTKQWFVMRVTYNRVRKAHDFISKDKTEAYFPEHYIQRNVNGKQKRILEPLLAGILFVYSTKEKVESYVRQLPFLTYYYNHFKTNPDGKNPPLTVAYDDMMNFIQATSVDNEHIKLVTPQQCHYKSGDRVRVIAGDFKGVEGHIARVAGQQRVIVEIENLCLIATAYVPTAFIEVITDSNI